MTPGCLGAGPCGESPTVPRTGFTALVDLLLAVPTGTLALWSEGRVTGLVDWVETSTGPADLDVAHCASRLAGLHGVRAARTFRRLRGTCGRPGAAARGCSGPS